MQDDEVVHVAKLPRAPYDVPEDCWDAPHGELRGHVLLPGVGAGAKRYKLEPLVRTLTTGLAPHVRGQRIALWHVPSCTSLALVPALRRLNAAPVWLNDRWSRGECVHALSVSEVHVVILGRNASVQWLPRHICVLHVDALPSTTVSVEHRAEPERPFFNVPPTPVPTQLCTDESVYFTSGTGGTPKGARLPHAAMDMQAMEKLRQLPFRDGTYLHLAPHYHVGGASSTLAALFCGADHVIFAGGALLRRSAAVLDCIRQHGVSILVVVPVVLQALVDAACACTECGGGPGVFPSVRALLVGGAAADGWLAAVARAVFPNAVCLGTYGLTEGCSSLGIAPLGASEYLAPARVELAVRASAPGARGRVVTRGDHVMRGYLGGDALLPGTWHDTGDIGVVSRRGALTVVGRVRDVIRSGGETVDASEVEKVLGAHTAVRHAAVVGVADPALGEAVVAAVALRVTVSTATLASHCRSALARYKCPRRFFVLGRIPTCALGKVQKRAVKDMVESLMRKQPVLEPRPKL